MPTTMYVLIARALLKEYSQRHLPLFIMVQDIIAQTIKEVHAVTAKRTDL